MDEINEELENKQVERVKEEVSEVTDGDTLCQEQSDKDYNQHPKTKKQRSQKQIEAFEKARKKRAENISLKKKEKAENKGKKKTTIKEEPSVIDSLPAETIETMRRNAVNPTPKYKPVLNYDVPPQYQHNPAPIINNYYYGTNDNNISNKKTSKKKKVVVEPSSSESESEEEEESYYEHEILQGGIQPTKPGLKYKFV
tara:strand:+ start:685 stop:1278 length:594 start_codon:yes stop_codon:yes gene_type:complete